MTDCGFLLMAMAVVAGQTLIPSETPPQQGTQIPWQMVLLLASGLWCLLGLKHRRLSLRVELPDVLLALTIGWIVYSGWRATGQGAPRAAIHATWQWVHMALLFILLRQWIHTLTAARAVVVAMLALATVEGAIGLYQYTIAFPAMREQFANDPDALLKAAGQWVPPDAPQRRLMEDRIMSREPLGTFALANSLAGLLVPWLLVALGLAADRLSIATHHTQLDNGPPLRSPSRNAASSHNTPTLSKASSARGAMALGGLSWQQAFAAGLVLGPTIVVLLLTKSRAAYVAFAVGMLLLASRYGAPIIGRWSLRKWALAVALCGAVLVALIFSGGLDRQVLTEAPKSLAYRVQYWQATWQMIADHPWWGVGPGQFQDRYTQYKLATASEEIADPHNFVLELAATSGLPAAAGFLAFLSSIFWQLIRTPNERRAHSPSAHTVSTPTRSPLLPQSSPDNATTSSPPIRTTRTPQSRHTPRTSPTSSRGLLPLSAADCIACGGPLLGAVLAAAVGRLFPYLAIIPLSGMAAAGSIAVICLVAVAWCPWLRAGRIQPGVFAVAIGALLLHLSASGGLSYAGVAATLWTLLALASILPGMSPTTPSTPDPNQSSPPVQPTPCPHRFAPAWLPWLATAVWAAMAMGWYTTAYRPTIESQGHLWAAQHTAFSPQQVDRHLYAAVEADPYNAAAWDALAQHLLQRWLASQPDRTTDDRRSLHESLNQAVGGLVAARPYSSFIWSRAAEIYLAIYARNNNSHALNKAIDALQRATQLYPTSAVLHARLALAVANSNDFDRARQQARRALQLDRITPHADKKLPPALRTAVERLLAEPPASRSAT